MMMWIAQRPKDSLTSFSNRRRTSMELGGRPSGANGRMRGSAASRLGGELDR